MRALRAGLARTDVTIDADLCDLRFIAQIERVRISDALDMGPLASKGDDQPAMGGPSVDAGAVGGAAEGKELT